MPKRAEANAKNEPDPNSRPIASTLNRRSPNERPRESGIVLIPEVPWGTHICLFYETKEDLLQTHAEYFEAGLRNNERCIWTVCPPVTEQDAISALRRRMPGLNEHLLAGRLKVASGYGWCVNDDPVSMLSTVENWHLELKNARAAGFDGLRLSCCALWHASRPWSEFFEYERELDNFIAGENIIALCTYWMDGTSDEAIGNVARMHQRTIAKRRGGWEFLEVPAAKREHQNTDALNGGIDQLPKSFTRQSLLTQKERTVLEQIIRGASSKEVARALSVSPRTVEFHRANIMKKLGTRNIAELVRQVMQNSFGGPHSH